MFSIGVADRARGATGKADAGLPLLIWLARIGVYLGLFVGVGGVFFARLDRVGASGGSDVIAVALRIGLVSAVASLGLQGLDLLGSAARRPS